MKRKKLTWLFCLFFAAFFFLVPAVAHASAKDDIEKYIARTIWNMKRSGAIRDDSTWTVLRNMRQGSEIK